MEKLGPSLKDIYLESTFEIEVPVTPSKQAAEAELVLENIENNGETPATAREEPTSKPDAPQNDRAMSKFLRLRSGRYRLGRGQFLQNPFVFIPARLMLSAKFNFIEVFQLLNIDVPQLVFRLNRANPTRMWNARLPHSRRSLIEQYEKLHGEGGGGGGKAHKKEVGGEEYVKYPPGSLEHYHRVLEENCRRILRISNSALIQAQTVYRIHEIWSDEYDEDVIGRWLQDSAPRGPNPTILGVADKSDFHPDIWTQLKDGCHVDFEVWKREGQEPPEVLIDPAPFYNREIKVQYDPKSRRPFGSIPHPCLTHLIISDNRQLLEQKMAEVVKWGLILINGELRAAEQAIQAVQLGLPLISLKFTGGTADLVIEAYQVVDKWVKAKRASELVSSTPPKPFVDDMVAGYRHKSWLAPFNNENITICNMLNVLVENWPDRFNEQSVFVIDMYNTTEDDIQDRITQTIAVVFGGEYELGGSDAEQKRLSYAWRVRHKFLYNAGIFKLKADILTATLLLLTMFSTFTAVAHMYLSIEYHNGENENADLAKDIALKLNILLPLLATVVKGLISVINPYLKYVALKGSSVKVETEIYAYRCKVGKYSTTKNTEEDDDEDEEQKEGEGDAGGADDNKAPNPRKNFSQSLDRIWRDLMASDVHNSSLKTPQFTSAALDDVNGLIRSNRAEQINFLSPLPRQSAKESTKVVDLPGEAFDVRFDHSSNSFFRGPVLFQDDPYLVVDDGIAELSAAEYMKIRVLPVAGYYTQKTPGLALYNQVAQIVMIICALSAAALTVFNLSTFIPVAIALLGGISAWVNYRQLSLRLLQTNLAQCQIHQLIVWWDSLSVIEKRVASNKDQVVKRAEAIIQAQSTIFQGSGSGGDESEEGSGEKEAN